MDARTTTDALRWEHLLLDCSPGGVRVTDREQGRPVGQAAVTTGPGWRPAGFEVDADEATWLWVSPEASARLRLTADRTISARLTITAGSSGAVLDGAPAVDWHGPFSCRVARRRLRPRPA